MAKDNSPNIPLVPVKSAQQRGALTRNVTNVFDRLSPQEKAEGRLWYPKVHEATANGADRAGISRMAGAGLVAAVSPNMDFDSVNIDAFDELTAMSGKQWDAVHRSAAAPGGKRLPETKKALAGLGVSRASDDGLMKAHRILSGEDVDSVLDRRTAPKTNSFAHNIYDPWGSQHVTIDGRAHDVAANQLRGWQKNRGISSADLTRGTSRYEHFEGAYRNAAELRDEPNGLTMQAQVWVGAKRMEKELAGGLLTKSGKPRQKGVTRKGQRYF